jgi:hypothetical protein
LADQANAVLSLWRTLRVVVTVGARAEGADVVLVARDFMTVGVDDAAHAGVETIALRFIAIEHAVRACVA